MRIHIFQPRNIGFVEFKQISSCSATQRGLMSDLTKTIRYTIWSVMYQKIHKLYHEDIIKWKHIPCYLPFVRRIHRSPVNCPHNDQWGEALRFSLFTAWTNRWANNGDAGDSRRDRAHYDVTVMLRLYMHVKTIAGTINKSLEKKN